jgi:peptidoglycan/xylan/chitin deacetylase (PgdA/CDA1 family)
MRLFGREVSGSCVVLYYHSIPAEYRQLFAGQMDKLARLTKPINVDAVPPLNPGLKYSAVTFDDSFENIFDNALPELSKRNIPATVFVPADLLGQTAAWWPIGARERQEKISTAERLAQLPAEMTTIGSHTLTHPKLPTLGAAEAERELRLSKAHLEEMLKRPIKIFSFPYGAFDKNLVSLCENAGYERVFTTLPLLAFRTPSEFVTGRVGVEPTDWNLEFYLKLMGAYRWLPYAFSIKRLIFGRT